MEHKMSSRALDGVWFVKTLLKSRWMMLVACFFVMSAAGGLYAFGLYSQEMKLALHYDQETLNNIAFFKDLGGNVGILSGIVFDFSGAWVCLLLGSLVNCVGYTMVWLAVTKRIARPAVWQMCLYIALGANSGSFSSTAAIVSGVKTFPENRGMVIGLIKAFTGLSGAVMTQLFRAIYGRTKSTSSFILLLGWFPSFVYLLLMFIVRPIKPVGGKHDKRNLFVFLGMAITLAIFLMIVILIHSLSKVGKPVDRGLAGIMVVIMLIPLGFVLQTEYTGLKRGQEEGSVDETSSVIQHETGMQLSVCASSEATKATNTQKAAVDIATVEINKPAAIASVALLTPEEETLATTKRPHSNMRPGDLWRRFITQITIRPRRGEDHTILQAMTSVDLWLLFLVATGGFGTGSMVVDNLGQLGAGLGYSSITVSTFVSLVSIWNFFGRVGFGFTSEIMMQRHGVPRPLFYAGVCVVLTIVCVLLAANARGGMYVGSVLIGISFGAQLPLLSSIVSEIFGLRFFGTLYNVATLASPLGTYLLSVRTAGHLYDREAAHQSHNQGALFCHGPKCYRTSFLIMAGVSLFGCLLSLILTFRTRHFYKDKKVQRQHSMRDM